MRGDGYYIVSTAFDLPNLRQNAYAYTRAVIRRRFVDRTTKIPKATGREAVFYLWYAPLQTTFYVVFFTYVVIHTAGWLIGELELVGFVIMMAVVIDRLGRPLLRVVPGTLAVVSEALRARSRRDLARVILRPPYEAMQWMVRMWRLEVLVIIPLAVLALVPYPLYVARRRGDQLSTLRCTSARERASSALRRATGRARQGR